jgi:hypothetical protein
MYILLKVYYIVSYIIKNFLFKTSAVFWMLYSFFGVIISAYTAYEGGTEWSEMLSFIRRWGITQRKNTTLLKWFTS